MFKWVPQCIGHVYILNYWPADLFNVGDVVGDPHSLLEDFQISVDNYMVLKVPTRQQSYPSGNCPVALIW